MKTVYLAWRHPTHKWYPVGELRFDGDQFWFRYVHGSALAEAVGFRPLVEFRQFDRVYASPELFATFANRIPSPEQARYAAYMDWLQLTAGDDDELDVLARSGGRRATDTFEVFPCPEPDEHNRYVAYAFVHGLDHLPKNNQKRALELRRGDRLLLTPEPDNEADEYAIKTETGERIQIGYVPRYLAGDLHGLPLLAVSATVERVNAPPVPSQFRVLCRIEAPWPAGFQPCGGEEFQPRAKADSPSCTARPFNSEQ